MFTHNELRRTLNENGVQGEPPCWIERTCTIHDDAFRGMQRPTSLIIFV